MASLQSSLNHGLLKRFGFVEVLGIVFSAILCRMLVKSAIGSSEVSNRSELISMFQSDWNCVQSALLSFHLGICSETLGPLLVKKIGK